MTPLYSWETEHHPFLSNLPSFRFPKKETPQVLEDYQSIYINSKENLIYTFNLNHQVSPLILQGFMIDDLKDFYIVVTLQEKNSWQTYEHFYHMSLKESSKKSRDLNLYLKNIREYKYAYFKDVKIVLEIPNTSGKRLEAYLYPPRLDGLPYYVEDNEPPYLSIIEKGMSIISFLELLQVGFFSQANTKISLEGILRLEFEDEEEEKVSL
jgi:hypothetical protein